MPVDNCAVNYIPTLQLHNSLVVWQRAIVGGSQVARSLMMHYMQESKSCCRKDTARCHVIS